MSTSPTPSELIEEYAAGVTSALERGSSIEFEGALSELTDLHAFLLSALNGRDDDGTVFNLAQLPGLYEPLHSSWLRHYRDILSLSALSIGKKPDELFSAAANIPNRLTARLSRDVPMDIPNSIVDLSLTLFHRIGDWWSRQLPPDTSSSFVAPHRIVGFGEHIYRRALRSFYSGWESLPISGQHLFERANHRLRDGGRESPTAFSDLARLSEFAGRHLRNTCYLVAAAVHRGDSMAAELAVDSLLKWLHQVLPAEGDIDLEWDADAQLAAMPWTSEEWAAVPLVTGRGERFSSTARFLQVAHQDACLTTLSVLLKWHLASQQETSLALDVAAQLYQGRSVERDALSARGSLRPANGFDDVLLALMRQNASGERWGSAKYRKWLDDMVGLLDGLQDQDVVPGRVYSPIGADSIDELRLAHVVLLLSAAPEGRAVTLPNKVQRELSDPAAKKTRSVERLADELLQAMTALEDVGSTVNAVAASEANLEDRRSWLQQFLTAIRTYVVHGRNEQIRLRPPARTAEFETAISEAFLRWTASPLDMFATHDVVDVELTRREVRFGGISKGELTEPPLLPPVSNAIEFFTERAEERLALDALQELARSPGVQVLPEQEGADLIHGLIQRADLLSNAHLTPIVLVGVRLPPTAVRNWLEDAAERGMPVAGAAITEEIGAAGGAYLFSVGRVRFYQTRQLGEQALFLARETFGRMRLSRTHGRVARVTFEPSEDGLTGALVVSWARDFVFRMTDNVAQFTLPDFGFHRRRSTQARRPDRTD